MKPEEQGKPEPDDPAMDERQVTVFEPEGSAYRGAKVANSRAIAPVRTREVSDAHPGGGDLAAAQPAERPAATSTSDTPDLIGLLRALRRRWKLAVIGGIVLSSLVAAAVYFLLPPPKHTTSALIYVAAIRPKEIFDTRESSVAYQTYQETQVILAKSRVVIEAALKKQGVSNLPTVCKQVDPPSWLADQIKVDFPRGSEILKISMTGAYPAHDLEMLVNAVTDSYLEEIVEQEKRERLARLDRLRSLFHELQDDLKVKREKYKEIAESMGASTNQNAVLKQKMLVEHVGHARQELLRLSSEIREAQARVKILKAREGQEQETIEAVSSADVEKLVEADEEVIRIKAQIEENKRQLDSFRRRAKNSGDPAIFTVQQEINRLQRDLRDRRRVLGPSLARVASKTSPKRQVQQLSESEQYLEILHEQQESLKNEIALLDQQMNSLSSKSMDFHWLEDEINLSGETAKTVGTEVQSMSVELKAPPRIRLIERAKAPTLIDPLRRLKFTAGSAVGVLVAFLGVLSFWEFRSRRIGTVNEVVECVGLKLVGSLPSLPKASDPEAQLVEHRLLIDSIDAVRTMLLRASKFESLRVIMVTSALKGEGKTSLSCHLATSLARAGRMTLLIDCDLRSPTVADVFCSPRSPGVCEILRGEASLDEVIWQSPVKSLFLVPAGRCDSTTLELLGQDRFRDTLSMLRERFEFIIVDTAPLLLVTDSMILSQYVDAAVFSILREVSQIRPVQAACERLSSLGVPILGAVVSGVARSSYTYRSYPYPAPPPDSGS
ncbi:MAG: polysaccharide biosynthesis tyrosine autokinase [Isosphaeraceae bacterium]